MSFSLAISLVAHVAGAAGEQYPPQGQASGTLTANPLTPAQNKQLHLCLDSL
jgi:hypothetical protein